MFFRTIFRHARRPFWAFTFGLLFGFVPMLMGVLFVSLSGATSAHAAPRTQDATLGAFPLVLSCTGLFARDASHESIAKAFGKGNVTTEEVGIGEGETAPATVLFPRDTARRLEIFWRDAKRKRGIAEIRIGDGALWRTPQGVAVGMPLADVEFINGKPFTLAGFGWDYGGTTLDWQGGALATQPGGCRLMLRFDQTAPTDADVDGDRDISSDDAGMRSAKPVVEWLHLRFETE